VIGFSFRLLDGADQIFWQALLAGRGFDRSYCGGKTSKWTAAASSTGMDDDIILRRAAAPSHLEVRAKR
jgi:hypothetical protein